MSLFKITSKCLKKKKTLIFICWIFQNINKRELIDYFIWGVSVRFGVRFSGGWLRRLRRLFMIRLELPFGDGLNLGSSLAKVTFEEEENDQSSEYNRKKCNWQNGIHSRTGRIALLILIREKRWCGNDGGLSSVFQWIIIWEEQEGIRS